MYNMSYSDKVQDRFHTYSLCALVKELAVCEIQLKSHNRKVFLRNDVRYVHYCNVCIDHVCIKSHVND